ncbi:MAG: DUF58 domain-containing protein [Chloroflexota bacterium]
MVPTGRLLLLLLATAIPLALDPLLPGFGWATPASLGLLAGLVWLDQRQSVQPGEIVVAREMADRLSIGEANPVNVVITNRTEETLRIQLRDEVPLPLEVSVERLELEVGPRATSRVVYSIVPPRRGDFQIGRLVVRSLSQFRLTWRQHAFPLTRSVKVYPNLRDMHRYNLMVRRGMLLEAGTRTARRFGQGAEFERLREYVPDDEFRRINWKATARRGVPISTEFETERSQNVMILLDAGRLMSAVADGLTKLDHALNAGLMLAYAASLRGDRVGLLAYADEVRTYLAPRGGRPAFLRIVDQLYRLESQQTESSHARAFSYLAGRSLRRSLLVLFTDIADPEPSRSLVAHLVRASDRHLVAVVTVADPALTIPAGKAPCDSRELYEKAVAQRMLDERRQVRAMLNHRGIITIDQPADRLSAEMVSRYLELKSRGRI